ncbi:MAG: hypothetical protein IAE82_15235 [Opitutaceae bacterium]|nr:hypothetical protein [Opitutaceae bacterium]
MSLATRMTCRLATLVAVIVGVPDAHAGFSAEGRRLMRDGLPFQVRGVCYQPAPIGDNPSAAAPYGDYYTAGYAALTARDLPNLRALGANVIRIYGWDPAANHTAFLDACYNGGVDPIFVLVNRWIDPSTNWSSTAAVDAIRQQFVQLDAGLGAHPAVLGIILGNETNAHNGNGTNPAYWAAVNSIAASIKQQTPSRLVSVAITDAIPQVAARDAAMTALDFWCVQTYRGTSLGTLFTEYAAASARPLVLTEFGTDAYNHTTGQPYPNNAEFTATTVAGLWTEIAANAATCAGACVFEYADEWWKTSSGSPLTHDAGGFPLASLPDGFANEEWWGLYAVSDNGTQPDTLTARATVAALRTAWTPPAVTVTTAPLSQTIAPGGSATLSVQAETSGGATLSYQWLKDGVVVPGATGAALSINGLTAEDSGWYAVRITSGATIVMSPAARLLVAQPDPGQVVNISLRGRPGEGANVLIAGFVINGNVPRRVLIRGVGPELVRLGVGDAHPDPRLRLFDGDGAELAANDDWGTSTDATEIAAVARSIGAFSLAQAGKDAALLRTLLPGAFTAHVSGPTGVSGIALVEVYEVP